MRKRTRRLADDEVINIVRVNNLRYCVEGYIERRHPDFSYSSGLNGFMSDFITAILNRDLGDEYRVFSKWTREMALYDDTTPEFIKESLHHVFMIMQRHIAIEVAGLRSNIQWEWLNAREVEIVIIGRKL